jgi:hypothetical protein
MTDRVGGKMWAEAALGGGYRYYGGAPGGPFPRCRSCGLFITTIDAWMRFFLREPLCVACCGWFWLETGRKRHPERMGRVPLELRYD